MEGYEIEGTTLLSWTIRVQARNEGEATEEAQRIAAWVEMSSSLATLHGRQHRIVRSRLIDLKADESAVPVPPRDRH
jgi:hypothetical protein